MSDISDSNSITSNGSYKRRISQIDNTIEHLTQEVKNLNNFVYKTEFECSLMTVRMKREKLKALSAIARAQVIMADMQVCVAEGELYTDVEKLKNFKKLRLDNEGANQRHICQMPARPSTATVSVQTTLGSNEKKFRKHSSSRKSPVDNSSSRKSLIDLSSEETVIIPSIYENTASHTEISQISPSVFSQGIFKKSPAKRSGSEVSLSSSVKAEFNDPFTQTQKEATKNSPAKKHKSDKKGDTKSRSKNQSNSQKSTLKQPQSAPKTVADLRKTAEKKSSASSTCVPARHTNLPEIISRPSTSTMTPLFSVNTTQSDLRHNSQEPRPYHLLPFYGSQQ